MISINCLIKNLLKFVQGIGKGVNMEEAKLKEKIQKECQTALKRVLGQ